MKHWLCVGALAFAQSLGADDPLAEFQDVQWETYRDEVRGFTFRYPYHWSSRSNSQGQRVFYDYNSVYDSRVTVYARSRDPEIPYFKLTRYLESSPLHDHQRRKVVPLFLRPARGRTGLAG